MNIHRLKINLLLAACIFFIIACDVFDIDSEPLIYPDKIKALTMDDLVVLNEKYQSKNPNLCSTLNEFGKTGFSDVLFSGSESPCIDREKVRIELTRPDTLIDYARTIIQDNTEFTGVSSSDFPELIEMEPLKGCIICEGPGIDSRDIEWKLVFSEQKVDGIPVHDTKITIVLDANGVNRIWGNWYDTDFYRPENSNFLMDEFYDKLTQDSILVKTENNEFRQVLPRRDQLVDRQQRIIVPVNTGDELEFRIAEQFLWQDNEVSSFAYLFAADIINGDIVIAESVFFEPFII